MIISRNAGIAALHGAAAAGLALALTLVPACETQASGVRQPAANTACIALYRPVCGLKDGKRKTYSNHCYAMRAGARVVMEEPCPARKGVGQGQPDPQ